MSETVPRADVEYGPIRPGEIASAARIYVESFPERWAPLFTRRAHASSFYMDLLDLVRRAYGPTFLAARSGDALLGYAAITEGTQRLLTAGLREGYIMRAAARALTGGYGPPLALIRRLVTSTAGGRAERAHGLDRLPQVYVIAIDPSMTGRGIGTRLLTAGRAACEPRVDRMWLRVEAHNHGAFRLYERIGFRTIWSDQVERVMVWRFAGESGE